eukprot:181978-Prymnesium_polylepis.1
MRFIFLERRFFLASSDIPGKWLHCAHEKHHTRRRSARRVRHTALPRAAECKNVPDRASFPRGEVATRARACGTSQPA